ncbi:MAG: site-specific integrase [Anaerolineae bacterium]|uniref:tyrosine-type recombinase/integrase n=1 Tax=Candidatus Amarolinea dominans TaxID=3140696 RepID=UPI001D8B02C5|nr:site-specific integrase [Anaerolineae bacterium]MBK7200803.1 site-specific integrase [Anaerolineae bacterium]MBK9093715.1 site-specific integrase [Anaerolineae bacterium]MBK9234238.1 site-specific integrase [Anaerolineae bacterium]
MADLEADAVQPSLFAPPEERAPAPPITQTPTLTGQSSLAAAITAFYPYMVRQGFADNTVKSFQSDLRLLGRHTGASRPLHQLSTQALQQFLYWLEHERKAPCSSKSYARRLTTLKVFFAWLRATEVIASDPAAPIIHLPTSAALPVILYDNEVKQMLQTSQDMLWNRSKPDARPYLLINLVLQTAMKKGEAMRVKLEHLDSSDPLGPAVYVRYDNPRYHDKERKLGLSPKLAPAIQQYLREYQPKVFLFECTSRNLEYVLGDTGKAAGMTKSVSFEGLRWTAAVRDYRTGMPAERLRLKMGLSEISWRETLERIRLLAAPGL